MTSEDAVFFSEALHCAISEFLYAIYFADNVSGVNQIDSVIKNAINLIDIFLKHDLDKRVWGRSMLKRTIPPQILWEWSSLYYPVLPKEFVDTWTGHLEGPYLFRCVQFGEHRVADKDRHYDLVKNSWQEALDKRFKEFIQYNYPNVPKINSLSSAFQNAPDNNIESMHEKHDHDTDATDSRKKFHGIENTGVKKHSRAGGDPAALARSLNDLNSNIHPNPSKKSKGTTKTVNPLGTKRRKLQICLLCNKINNRIDI